MRSERVSDKQNYNEICITWILRAHRILYTVFTDEN